jgi:hypothetical protein
MATGGYRGDNSKSEDKGRRQGEAYAKQETINMALQKGFRFGKGVKEGDPRFEHLKGFGKGVMATRNQMSLKQTNGSDQVAAMRKAAIAKKLKK